MPVEAAHMKDLFSKLGEIAQTATGGALSGTTRTPGAGIGSGGTMDNLLGSLKGSVPNSMGGVGGLLGAGALGGILGALLSSGGVGKTARKLGEGALMVGGTAVAAGFAWKLYQKWSQNTQNAPTSAPSPMGTPNTTGTFGTFGTAPAPIPAATEPVLAGHDPAALLVLEAMVFSARADGHMDDMERNAVHSAMQHLFPGTDVSVHIDSMMNCPLDPERLAQRVANPEQARDLYRLSRMVIIADHSMERAYLDALATALRIQKAEQNALDEEVAALQAASA